MGRSSKNRRFPEITGETIRKSEAPAVGHHSRNRLDLYVTECIVYMFRAVPVQSFLSGFSSFLIGWEFYGPNYLRCALAGSVPFPLVSLQRQVACLLLRPVLMCSSQGRAYTVSWLVGVQIKVML